MAIIRQGARPEDHFSLIPNSVARHSCLSLQSKGLYLYLRSHREGWSMQTDRIASALGIGRTSFWKYSKELIDHGYLIREQGSDDRGRFSSNDYVVLSEPDLSRVEEPCPPCSQLPRTVNTVNGESEQHKKTNSFKKTIEKKEDPLYPPKGDETRFVEFWNVYDKKVAVSVARKKYKQALKKVDEDTLIEAARKYVQSQKAIGKHPQFTANPATWLNQERWNDELEPVAVFDDLSFDDKEVNVDEGFRL